MYILLLLIQSYLFNIQSNIDHQLAIQRVLENKKVFNQIMIINPYTTNYKLVKIITVNQFVPAESKFYSNNYTFTTISKEDIFMHGGCRCITFNDIKEKDGFIIVEFNIWIEHEDINKIGTAKLSKSGDDYILENVQIE